MKIEYPGCYSFSLNSDDGSILWIDNEIVVDNDGSHGMKLKVDTIPLETGVYPVKLWYYQGYPDKFGLQFDAKLISKIDKCSIPKIEKQRKVLNANFLFETGKYELSSDAKAELDNLVLMIKNKNSKSIEIIGHTDNVGSVNDNNALSLNRASSVGDYLKSKLSSKNINIIISGLGDLSPIDSNDTVDGRSKNRRVEILY